MNNEQIEAKITELIILNISVEEIKSELNLSSDMWNNRSASVYNNALRKAIEERNNMEKLKHISVSPNDTLSKIMSINWTLSEYALSLPSIITEADVKLFSNLTDELPISKSIISVILNEIEKIILRPNVRVIYRGGRFEKFEPFKVFLDLIDTAVVSYYRKDYTSCFLTLVPIIEGVILRWMNYDFSSKKPPFEKIKKFFQASHGRQPIPYNIQFHKIYCNTCSRILINHFYKNTRDGTPYDYFSRHIPSHMLREKGFDTRENCIRIFILLDNMAEIYCYESRKCDGMFQIDNEEGYIENHLKILTTKLIEPNYSSMFVEHLKEQNILDELKNL
ncbi:hypothetical protein [Bernardetia sp. MNP-M8]|uniref:hypothetical protein n=1 Tax=Bernardetia sp. MNP-M8 TaxID=3127470 RepID=UPI0030D104E0